MFKKVLIVDDIDVVNIGVQKTLESLKIPSVVYSAYCDDAYLKLKKGVLDEAPFDAIICDLSFAEDHRCRQITSGQQLIEIIRKEYPALKIIVFSIEDYPQTIKDLWEPDLVDAYVCKDREGIKELKMALAAVNNGKRYLPRRLTSLLKQQNTIVLSGYDEHLLILLAKGYNQYQIEETFKKEGISPASRSSIEKRLKDLRDEFDAKTNVHLITILKDDKLI